MAEEKKYSTTIKIVGAVVAVLVLLLCIFLAPTSDVNMLMGLF